MKFLYIRSYSFFNIYIANLCHFAALGTHQVRFLISITLLILRFVSKLVVYDKVCIDEQGNGVVYRCTAHPELFLLFQQLQEFCNLKASVYRVYGIQYGKTFRCAPASVLLKIFGEYLSRCSGILAVLHLKPLHAKASQTSECKNSLLQFYNGCNLLLSISITKLSLFSIICIETCLKFHKKRPDISTVCLYTAFFIQQSFPTTQVCPLSRQKPQWLYRNRLSDCRYST